MAVRAIGLLILCTSLPVLSLAVAPIANCSFEVDFCNWTNGSWANGIWHRGKGPRPNEGTGPISTSPEVEGESYIYLQSSDFRNQSNNLINPGRIIALVTPELPVVKCVAFLFMKYGLAMGLLSFGVNPNGNLRTKLWEKSNESSLREWTCVNITVPIQSSNNTKVYFEAESGQNVLGDIAMDAVHIYDQDCSLSVGCSSFLNKPIESSTSPMMSLSRSPSSLTAANLTITPHVENSTLTTTTPAPPSTTTPVTDNNDYLYIIIVPGVLLVAAIIIALIFYKRRQLRKQEEEKKKPPVDDEEYDHIAENNMLPPLARVARVKSNEYNANPSFKNEIDDETTKYNEINDKEVGQYSQSNIDDEPHEYVQIVG